MKKNFSLLVLIFLTSFSCSRMPKQDKLGFNASAARVDSLKLVLKQNQITLDSLQHELQDFELDFKSLESVTSGDFERINSESDDELYGQNYRVEIYVSEIYKTMYVTRIEYYGEGAQRIGNRNKINLEKELNITGEETNSLEFVKWNSSTEFEIKLNNRLFVVSIVDVKTIKIKEI